MGNVQEKGSLIEPDENLLETRSLGSLLDLAVYQNQVKNAKVMVLQTKYSIGQVE